jgi:hypothetical protein
MKKLFAIIFTVLLLFSSNVAYATDYLIDENGNLYSPEWYNADGKIKLNPTWYEKEGKKLQAEADKVDISIPKIFFTAVNGDVVSGKLSYPNYDELTVGDFDLQWVFTPDDPKYETRTGVFHFYIWPPDTEEQKGKLPDPVVEEPTNPSLTATTVQLTSLTAYDINLNDKVAGSSYNWTSSDETIATVDKSGMVRAKKEGKTNISCQITLPDATTHVLTSEVVVGVDDNAPLLTETAIDLETGDIFDINLENKIAKSKYRWAISDRSVATINCANGKVTAKAPGTAFVTCTITTPERQVIVLRCDVNVTEKGTVTE